jgi:SAM-dependent methyltransferase
MKPGYTYIGNELELFGKATRWKSYVASSISSFITGDVAEAGAGTGNFTPFLQSPAVTSWTYLEPDGSFRDILRSKINRGRLPPGIIGEKLAELPAGARFDTILYLDVLEHIEDDRSEIQTMTGCLNPGGHIIILSPAYASLYSLFDKEIGHYRRYNRKQLTGLFDNKKGIVSCKYLDSAGFFTSLANRWWLRQTYPTPQQIRIWDSLLVPVSRIADRLFGYAFGRSVLLVWRKNN